MSIILTSKAFLQIGYFLLLLVEFSQSFKTQSRWIYTGPPVPHMFNYLFCSHLPDEIFQHCGIVNEGVEGIRFDGLEALLNGAAVVAKGRE